MSSLTVLLLLPWLLPSLALDGCQSASEWMCGDKCIPYWTTCLCGGKEFGAYSGEWCCQEGACNRTGQEEGTCQEGICATCSGEVIKLTQTCRGGCNFYEEDEDRNHRIIRSHVSCGEQCVPEEDQCWRCPSRLAWCREQGRREEACPNNYSRCNTTLGLPGQCVYTADVGDKRLYSCLDRSDEQPFQHKDLTTTALDLSGLLPCNDSLGLPGLLCDGAHGEKGGKCLWLGDWCWLDTAFPCANVRSGADTWGIASNDPRLCSNFTFWAEHNCGERAGVEMTRCKGSNSGQCAGDLGVLGDSYKTYAKCGDRSDVAHGLIAAPIGPCYAHEFRCQKNNASVCLPEELRCDQHPACDDSEDEDEEYCKAAAPESAVYLCPSPHHPGLRIWTTPCDGKMECFEDRDESGCDTDVMAQSVIGEYTLEV